MSGRMEIMAPESWQRIRSIAVDHSRFFVGSLRESMLGRKSQAFGDVMLPPAERIARFMDDEQRGVNAQLLLSNPDEYEKRLRRYMLDIRSKRVVSDQRTT